MQVNETRVLTTTSGAFDGVTDLLVYDDTIVTVSERSQSIHVVEEHFDTSYYMFRDEQEFSGTRSVDVHLQALRVTGNDVTTTVVQASDAAFTLSWNSATTTRPVRSDMTTMGTQADQHRSFAPDGQFYMSLDDTGTLRWVHAYTGQVFDTSPTAPVGFSDVPIHLSGFVISDVMGRRFAFGYSEEDGAIVSYFIGPNGVIRPRDILNSDDAFYAGRPHALEIAHFDDRSILIVADSQTGAISTVKVNEWGGLFYMHSLYDSRDTRFDDVVDMDYVSVGGRHFIVAGGADDGITLLELTPDGMLHVHLTLEDTTTTTLNNVSAVHIAADGPDGLYVHVASQNESGLTEFKITLSDLADLNIQSDDGEFIYGTTKDDIIWARDGADTVMALDGDDRIIDGKGIDHLYGGAGADIFVMTPDGRRDYIHDFSTAEDVIDFSHVDHLNNMDQLKISQRENGDWLVAFGTERIEVTLTSSSDVLTEDNFLFY